MRAWRALGKEVGVIVALHGFNDYSNAFTMPGEWWAENGITTYAYDQRGFGDTHLQGIWPGVDNLVHDLSDVIAIVRARHDGTPIFIVGASMGGAVILAAYGPPHLISELNPRSVRAAWKSVGPPLVDGVILAAPAVWGRATMNLLYRGALWLSAHLVPAARVSGKDLGITPSDNTGMLRALSRDPLVIKDTRTDTVYGLVNLMDVALEAAGALRVPALILYGEKDEVIPKGATQRMVELLDARHRFVLYPDGYHMLFRDLQGEVVWKDVWAWMLNAQASLPSGNDLE